MCGIIGTVDWSGNHPPDLDLLRRMLGVIRHRGPDEFGIYLDLHAGLGCARLSIVDLSTGQQPIANEDGSLWIVFNGEVYNHPELRATLERAGHRFRTRTDTEVILHLYEEHGPACLEHLNGQFAIAIWDTRQRELFLARDRLGIRPLFYAPLPGGLAFASEVKALFLHPRISPRLEPFALAQTFTFWAALSPRTSWEGIRQLPPGHYLIARGDALTPVRYWQVEFPPAGEETPLTVAEAAERLRDLLADATRLRLRADVEVGSYLSGGIDSTMIAALIRQHTPSLLCTFSIAFAEPTYDEREHQEIATAFLRTKHRRTECSNQDIGRILPDVIWHAETPLMRTSPAPMYLLSRLVHQSGIKVVLTGEGADEFLGGYNIYKEDKVRRFWSRQPASIYRPLLLRRLYPYIGDLERGSGAYLAAFFRRNLTDTEQPGYSHLIRWHNTSRLWRLFAADLRARLNGYAPMDEFLASLNGALARWSALAQAQYIEVATFMSPYLLSSQGDRMMAANSVEGRFPFLDHRVVEFCNHLPPQLKMLGLREKRVLKKSAQGLLPPQIWRRRKQPYRAPIHPAFFSGRLEYVEELLSPETVRAYGYFEPGAVTRLVKKCRSGLHVSERDDMALIGVLSTQLLHYLFIEHPRPAPTLDVVRVCRGKELPS